MRKIFVLLLGLSMLLVPISGERAFAATTPIDFTGFTGAGFSPDPGVGQLDSDIWRTTGFNTNIAFGGTCVIDDCARGSSGGGVSTGGIYAFDVGGGDIILGVQPIADDFTPGTITLKVVNESGATADEIYISYEIWTRNDQPRSNSLNFAWSLDDTNYTNVPALDYSTTEVADVTPTWQSVTRSTTLTGVDLANGGTLYLQWTGDDVSGAGSRDEYGIDDIEVRVGDPTAITLSNLTASSANHLPLLAVAAVTLIAAGGALWRQRRTSA